MTGSPEPIAPARAPAANPRPGPAPSGAERLLARLAELDVPHCVLPDAAASILVDRQRAAELDRVAAELRWKRLAARDTSAAEFLALDAGQEIVRVHVRFALPLRLDVADAGHLPWESFVLASRRLDAHGVHRADPHLAALLRAIWSAADADAPQSHQLQTWVQQLLGDEAAAALPDLHAAVRVGLPAFDARPSALRRALRRCADALRPGARRPALQAGGLVVAFAGCDGSGKSTVTRELHRWLGGALEVRRAYLGSGQGSSSLLRWPLLLLHRLATRLRPPRPAAASAADSHAAHGSHAAAGSPSLMRRLLRPVWSLALSREKRLKLRSVWRARQNGAVVLCDRYPQNEIPGFNDGPLLQPWRQHRTAWRRALSRWEARPYEWAQLHAPDLVVKLRVSAAVALRRKPDMTAPEVARRIAAVDALRFGTGTRTLVVDADAPIEQVLGQVKAGIWEGI